MKLEDPIDIGKAQAEDYLATKGIFEKQLIIDALYVQIALDRIEYDAGVHELHIGERLSGSNDPANAADGQWEIHDARLRMDRDHKAADVNRDAMHSLMG